MALSVFFSGTTCFFRIGVPIGFFEKAAGSGPKQVVALRGGATTLFANVLEITRPSEIDFRCRWWRSPPHVHERCFFFDRKWRFYGPKKRGQRHEVNEALKKGASCFRWISFFTMENKLLLISINYAPKIQPQLPKEMVRSNVFQVHQYLPALQQFFNDLSRLAINKIQERCEFRILWMISKKIQEPQQIPGI